MEAGTEGWQPGPSVAWPRWLLAVGPVVGAINQLVYNALLPFTGLESGGDRWISQFLTNLLWIPLTPVVVGLAERFPLDGPRRWRSLMVHWACVLAAVVAVYLGYFALRRGFHALTGWAPYPSFRITRRLAAGGWLIDALIFWTIAGVVHMRRWRGELARRAGQAAALEAQLARTELALLKAQLNPHFLFNTLHTIASLMRRDPATADRMVSRLGTFLRSSLAGGAGVVTLREELEYVTAYVDIERERFRDRLVWRLEMEPDLGGAVVPSMLLQPMVENAIRHGLERRPGSTLLAVSATRSNGSLVLRVDDDGAGFPAAVMSGGSRGIGLANISDRLRRIYGAAHRIELSNGPHGGASVEITLPLRFTKSGDTKSDDADSRAHS